MALTPLSEKVFQIACRDADVDIITFDMSSRLPFMLKMSTLNIAIQRGIHFEIQYAHCLRGKIYIILWQYFTDDNTINIRSFHWRV